MTLDKLIMRALWFENTRMHTKEVGADSLYVKNNS